MRPALATVCSLEAPLGTVLDDYAAGHVDAVDLWLGHTDAFIKALETVTFPADIFGSPITKFGPKKRQGSDQARLSQIVDGKWKVLE